MILGLITVLTGNDGPLAGVVSFQRVGNTKCGRVVGAQNCIQFGSVCIVCGNDSVHSGLSGLSRPVSGCNCFEIGLSGLNYQLACIDVGLQNIHSTAEEESCIVVAGVTGYQLNIERSCCIVQIQPELTPAERKQAWSNVKVSLEAEAASILLPASLMVNVVLG